MSPFQGFRSLSGFLTQGVALGYRTVPFQGMFEFSMRFDSTVLERQR
jgi:hypothetical protein